MFAACVACCPASIRCDVGDEPDRAAKLVLGPRSLHDETFGDCRTEYACHSSGDGCAGRGDGGDASRGAAPTLSLPPLGGDQPAELSARSARSAQSKAGDEASSMASRSTAAAGVDTPCPSFFGSLSMSSAEDVGAMGAQVPVGAEEVSEESAGQGEGEPATPAFRQGLDMDRVAKMHKLRCFLASTGFRGVRDARRKHSGLVGFAGGITYPLHVAVRMNDPAAVDALLWAGSSVSQQDSDKMTAVQLARKLDRSGSHQSVLHLLHGRASQRDSTP